MIKSFQSKLLAVKNDVSESFKQVAKLPLVTKLHHKQQPEVADTRNSKPQSHESWADLYRELDAICKKAEIVGRDTVNTQRRMATCMKSVVSLDDSVKELPLLFSQIHTLQEQIGLLSKILVFPPAEVQSQFTLIEDDLISLDVVTSQLLGERSLTADHQKHKENELRMKKEQEQLAAKLEQERRKKGAEAAVVEAEKRKNQELHKFYELAHQEDMERYRSQLKLRQQASEKLTTVTIEPSREEKNDLESFLADESEVFKNVSQNDPEHEEVIQSDYRGRSNTITSSDAGLEWDDQGDHLQITDILEENRTSFSSTES